MILELCLCAQLALNSPQPVTLQKQWAFQYKGITHLIKGLALTYKGYRMIHDSKINIRFISMRW